MTTGPSQPADASRPREGGGPEGDRAAGAGQPGDFQAEIRAAVRYEHGLAVKAAAVLAALAVLLVLRALYFG